MANVRISFKRIDNVTPDEIKKIEVRYVYENVDIHMIYDINIYGKFTRSSILVADDHKTAPPLLIKYSSIVSKERIRIEFLPPCLKYFYFMNVALEMPTVTLIVMRSFEMNMPQILEVIMVW